jgi:hypothetical protein
VSKRLIAIHTGKIIKAISINKYICKMKIKLTIIILTFFYNVNIFCQSLYNVNSRTLSFLHARRTHYPSGSNGTAAGNVALYTNVITIGTQQIDCIIKTVSLTGGQFLTTLTPSFDYNQNSSGLTANKDSFFSPLFSWNSGGGNCRFEFQFILGGSFNTSTLTGTNVILQNVYVNTYDIDGNGTTNSNQYNEFGGFSTSQYQTTTGGYINTTYNTTTSKTRFASTTDQNIATVTDDRTRVRVFYQNLSKFDFLVGASTGGGTAYYFIDFGIGPNWTNTPSVLSPPILDLNTTTSGLNNSTYTDACNTYTSFTVGSSSTNLSGAINVNNIYLQFDNTQILDGSSELLNINGATAGANIALNFNNGASIPQVTHNSITYNVTASRVSNISKLTFSRASGTLTAVQAETLIDNFRYINTDCISLTLGDRFFTVTVREGSFESEPSTFQSGIVALLPVELINFNALRLNNTNSKLTWATISEFQNNYFEVLKSANGKTWVSIGKVLGAGTSNTIKNYEFTDLNFSQSSYYKLRQVDFNGHASLSNILFLKNNDLSFFNIFPNPSNGRIQIRANEELNFIVTDLTGKIVARDKTQNTPYSIELSTGIYFIKLANDLNTFVQKIIIQ